MDLTLPLQLGAFGVLLIVVYAIFRLLTSGQFVPRHTVDMLIEAQRMIIEAKDAEIERSNHRGDEWQKAYEGERHVSEVIRLHNGELIEVVGTVKDVLHALRGAAADRRNDAESA